MDLRERLDSIARQQSRATSANSRIATCEAAPTKRVDVLGGAVADIGGAACWQIETTFLLPEQRGVPRPATVADPVCPESKFNSGELGTTERSHDSCVDLRRTLILDIETGGFAGTPVFLIGVLRFGSENSGAEGTAVGADQRRIGRLMPVHVTQWLARDYPEERAILVHLAAATAQCCRWITFNGRAFDEPFLRDRATRYGIHVPRPEAHVDLLPLARRRWRGELPNCRLATLERHVLGREPRVGDVPGGDIPELFHHFVRTGNAAPLRPVLEHNRRDLLATAELALRFPAAASPS